jgi:hypothetical protein
MCQQWELKPSHGMGAKAVVIGPLKDTYLLMDEYEMQYVMVTIDPNKLPSVSTTEKILIVQGEMQDFLIRNRIQNATNQVELQLGFPLEPHLYTSVPRYPGQMPSPCKSNRSLG